MNEIILMGRITKDPELTEYQDGNCRSMFTLAVPRKFNRETTDFITCKAFGPCARFLHQYIHKGERIAVTGELHVDHYTNNNDEPRTFTTVYVDHIEFADSKKPVNSYADESTAASGVDMDVVPYYVIEEMDDLPF